MIIYKEPSENWFDKYYSCNLSWNTTTAQTFAPHAQFNIKTTPELICGLVCCGSGFCPCIENEAFMWMGQRYTYQDNAYRLAISELCVGPVNHIRLFRSEYNNYWFHHFCIKNNPFIRYDKNLFEGILYYCIISSSYCSQAICACVGSCNICIGGSNAKLCLKYEYDGNYKVYINNQLARSSATDTNFTNVRISTNNGCWCSTACVCDGWCVYPYCWETIHGKIGYQCKLLTEI